MEVEMWRFKVEVVNCVVENAHLRPLSEDPWNPKGPNPEKIQDLEIFQRA